MKSFYPAKALLACVLFFSVLVVDAQQPTVVTPGICSSVIANFNTNDNGFNSPSIYGGIYDGSFFYNATRGYWTDYVPPITGSTPPSFPRGMSIISPPIPNPNPNNTFNVGFYYIVGDPTLDKFQVKIISVTQTPSGTVTDVKATFIEPQSFSAWSTPTPYVDGTTPPVPNGPTTPFMTGQQGYICIRLIDSDIVNAPNTTFRVEVDYILNSPFFAVFDNLSVGASNIPLPVNFIGMRAERNDLQKSVDLKWDVGDEIDVKEYRVEKSLDGSSFSTAGVVEASQIPVYSFTDGDAPALTLYYRIKSVDIDGKFKYSGVVRLAANALNSFSNDLQAYPIPARNEVTIQHKKLTAKAKLVLTGMDGKVQKVIFPTQGSSNTFIDLSGVAPGVYLLRLEDENGAGKGIKLIKN